MKNNNNYYIILHVSSPYNNSKGEFKGNIINPQKEKVLKMAHGLVL